MDENKLVLGNGATPMTIAELVTRECKDKEVLNDVIYYIKAFIERNYE